MYDGLAGVTVSLLDRDCRWMSERSGASGRVGGAGGIAGQEESGEQGG